MIDFDMMLVHVGEFGIYQKILFLFQAPFAMFVTFTLFGQLFFYLYPRVYWCQEGPCIDTRNLTAEQRRNLSVPWHKVNRDFDPCNKFKWRPEQIQEFVELVESSCTNVVENRGSRQQGQRGQPDNQCDYEINEQKAVMTTRTPRYAQYGRGRGYYDYSSTTRGYYDGYEETTTTWPSPTGTTRSSTGDGRGGLGGQPTGGGSRWPPPPTSPNSNSAASRGGNARGDTCPYVPVPLRLNANYSINAESITNMTERLGNRAPEWARDLLTCRNWTWEIPPLPRMPDPPYLTLVTENPDGGWMCNPERRIQIANAIFYVGAIIGGIGIGYIADTRGRVPALVTANVLGCIGGVLSALFYTNFYLFLFFRFIAGMAFDNCFTMIYILVLEYVGPTYRTLVANLSIAVFYTIGTLILPGLAILISNWQIYALAISIPMSLALVGICIVPESARWLLSKGRTKEATRILRSFARVNRKNVAEEIFVEFEEGATKLYEEFSQEKEPSLWEAFKKPRIAKNFLFLTIIWALIALVYDGHSRNILNIGNNVFFSFAIASSTEFPADMMLIFTLDRFGRRWLAFGSMLLSGGFSLVSAFIPQAMMTASLVTALIARFFVNVAFNIGLQYAAELLPTVIRAQGVNVIHIMGYVASIVSPFIASLGRSNPALSLSLLGILACVSGILCLFLPETLGEDLPNTLEEGQEFGKDQSFWNCPICAKPRPEDEEPMEQMEPTPVQLRNNMRTSLRGEAFRSSIISTTSLGRRVTPTDHLLMNPGGTLGGHTKLRRVYTH